MRNARRRFENISLTDQQKTYIQNNWESKSDPVMARKLKISAHIIRYYRRFALELIKNPGRVGNIHIRSIDMSEVNDEIKAIQMHGNYPSFMNGAIDRMKHLMNVKNGIR
jgi:hypothetical protein